MNGGKLGGKPGQFLPVLCVFPSDLGISEKGPKVFKDNTKHR